MKRMQKRSEDLIITRIDALQKDFMFFEVASENPFDFIVPGQFVNAYVPGSKTTFLRRPFSIHDVDYAKNTLQLLIKVVGDGTKALSEMQAGVKLNLIYPLGNGFSLDVEGEVLLVGGGYGIAPLYHLAKELLVRKAKPVFLLGGRTKDHLVLLDKFAELAELHISTEDGSLGHKGLLTQNPVVTEMIKKVKRVYSCGPELMMKAISQIAEQNNIDCEVSLDHLMGCGIGVCLCCVAPTVNGNEVVCTTGPVFNSKILKWQTSQ